MILDPNAARIGDLVTPRQSFMPSIDLDRAHDPAYRRLCRDEYIYLPEDEVFWKHLANALLGQLAGGRRTIFEVGPYGAGKSLLDAVRGHLLADPADHVLLDKLGRHAFLRERYDQLVAEGPFLPVFVVGSQAAGTPIDAVVMAAIARALPSDLSLSSDHDRAIEWINGLAGREEMRADFVSAVDEVQPYPPAGGRWAVESLRLGLEQRHPAALVAFRHAQAQAVRWPTAAFGATRSVDILGELLRTHVGSAGPYSGIVLFFDEFSQWVDTLSEADRAASISTLQGLVEWVNHSPRTAMVISSQVRPVLGESYNALETLLTRTQEVPFGRRSYASFLAHVLERRLEEFPPVDSQAEWPGLEAAHTKLFGPGTGMGPRDYYPFHPGAVRALATLTDQLGARERSVAQLLGADADEEGGFGAFLAGPLFEFDGATRRLRLFTLDRLFPYFAVRLRDDHPQLHARYEEIVGEQDTGETIRIRIARVIVLSELLGPAFPMQPTVEGITALLDLPSKVTVDESLNDLIADGLVIDAGDRGYRVGSAGRISKSRLDREIERRVHELGPSGETASSSALGRRLGQAAGWAGEISRRLHVRPPTPSVAWSDVEAAELAAELRVTIDVAVQRATLGQLPDVARRAADERGPHAPTIYVVLASDADTDADALADSTNRARMIAAAGYAIGLPEQPARVAELLTRVAAIEQLAAEDAFAGDELVAQVLLMARDTLLRGLVAELDPANFRWLLPDDGEATELRLSDLGAVADRLARALASHLPRGLRTDIGTDVKTDVASMLLLGDEIRLALDRTNKKAHQILHDGLAPIGVLEVAHRPDDPFRVARIVAPDPDTHPDTREIWDLLLDAVEGRRALAEAVTALGRPPYMLPRNLGVYILAAILGYTRAHVVADGGAPQRPQADQMRRLWDEPARFRFVAARGLRRDQVLAAFEVAAIVGPEAHPTMRKALDQRDPDDGMLRALQVSAGRWHERVGRKAADLADRLGLTWPAPLAEWLILAPRLAGAEPDAVPDLLVSLATSEGDAANQLTLVAIQVDALRDVLVERDALLAASERTDAAVVNAMQAFIRDPLASDATAGVRAALTTTTSQPAEGDRGLPNEESGTVAMSGSFASRELTTADLQRLATALSNIAKEGQRLTGSELVRRLAASLGRDQARS